MLPPPPMKSPEVPSGGGGDRQRSFSYSPSILIIAAILAFVIVAIASIHLLLRLLSRHSRSSTPFISTLSSSSSSSSSSASASDSSGGQHKEDPKSVVDSLPLFSLSSVAAKSSSSPPLDCAVCLSPFEPRDELRLLPSCGHAFHSQCIDTWLRSTLSCPLCRSSIASPHPPAPAPVPPRASIGSSESFRIEIGSVSRRTDSSAEDQTPPPPAAAAAHVRTYSLGSSFEYLVEEEVEAVLARIRRPANSGGAAADPPTLPPGSPVAEMAGGGGSRSWLREYVDRLASSASSSFSSLRRSRRIEAAATGAAGGGGSGGDWDLEGNLHMHLEEEDGGFSSFYRWLVGA